MWQLRVFPKVFSAVSPSSKKRTVSLPVCYLVHYIYSQLFSWSVLNVSYVVPVHDFLLETQQFFVVNHEYADTAQISDVRKWGPFKTSPSQSGADHRGNNWCLLQYVGNNEWMCGRKVWTNQWVFTLINSVNNRCSLGFLLSFTQCTENIWLGEKGREEQEEREAEALQLVYSNIMCCHKHWAPTVSHS